MTEGSRTRLLLDRLSVQGPMVQIACTLLFHNPLTPAELLDTVSPGRENAEETELIPFLLDSGLVYRYSGRLRLAKAYRTEWSSALNLLNLLHTKTDVNSTFRFIWERLIDQPKWAACFLNRDDVWPMVNETKSTGWTIPHLNSNRMASWLRLASWVGLVQPERSNTFCVIPTEKFVMELLSIALQMGEECSLAAWVADVEGMFCQLTTSPGILHHGFASTLGLLCNRGVLEVRTYSDEHVFDLGHIRGTHIVVRKGAAA